MKELEEILVDEAGIQGVDIAGAVAHVVVATAAVSCAADLDLVQAAYNWIDNPSTPLPRTE